MLLKHKQVVSPQRFDQLFKEQAIIAEFARDEEGHDYFRRTEFLTHLIRLEAEKHFGPESDQTPFVSDNIWPDHTRGVDVTPTHCTPVFLLALHSLLSDDFRDYRIQLCVYGDQHDGNYYIGSMALSADHVLIEE